jgi:ligand-binding sensor domain-containing protein
MSVRVNKSVIIVRWMLSTGRKTVNLLQHARHISVIATIGVPYCFAGCGSDDDPIISSSKDRADAGSPNDAGRPDDIPDAQVRVLGEWVNFTNGDTVDAIVDGPNDVWIATSGGLANYQKSSGNWRYYDHGNSALPCNGITSLALDQEGRVWVGTRHNGLARFDGESWLPVQIPEQNGYSVPVHRLYVDPQGALWAASIGMLYEFDGTNWATYNFINPASSVELIEGMVGDEEAQVWVATSSRIGTLDRMSGTLIEDTSMPMNGEIQTLTIDRVGDIWTGLTSGVAHRKAGNWTVYDTSNSGLPSNNVHAISEDLGGGMWLGTGAGLVHFQDDSWQTQLIPNLEAEGQAIFSVAASSDKSTWIGTYQNGLYRLKDGVVTSIDTNQSGFPSNNVYAFAEDSAGTLWAGTWNGLARWQHGRWFNFNSSNSPLPSAVVALALDNDGNTLWMGTSKGVAKYNDGNWQVWDATNSNLPSSSINDVLVDRGGLVWASTAAGLAKYDGTSWQSYTRANSPLPSNRPWGLAVDRQGNLWIGLATDLNSSNSNLNYVPGGLAKYDGKAFELFTTQNSGLPIDNVFGVAIDEKDVVWLATGSPDGPAYQDQGGLVRFDGNTWQTFDIANSLLPNNYVQCVTADKHGSIWVGTYQGLAKYDGSQWQVWHHNDSGLSDEVIWKILVDRRGNTWIGTGFEGLSVYKPGGVELEM